MDLKRLKNKFISFTSSLIAILISIPMFLVVYGFIVSIMLLPIVAVAWLIKQII